MNCKAYYDSWTVATFRIGDFKKVQKGNSLQNMNTYILIYTHMTRSVNKGVSDEVVHLREFNWNSD